jgi:transposase-like protein
MVKDVSEVVAMKRCASRKRTPWEGDLELNPTQTFLKRNYTAHYDERHLSVGDSDEATMVNSYAPTRCPYCGIDSFKKSGYTRSGVQRYKCTCGKTFLPTTGTIFDDHKISISEWIEYCLNLFRHVSITADSWNNKNAFNTSRYWLEKVFLTLEGTQNSIVLSGNVWMDETYYSVRSEDIERNALGEKLSGISSNQICIGVATDKQRTILLVEGVGRPTQKRTMETFGSHIVRGSTLIHDEDSSHRRLIKQLELTSVAHTSKSIKNLTDKENPLYPVNRVHAIMKLFLNAHRSFKRDSLQGYLDLFAFVSNEPIDPLEKVAQIVNLAFANPKLLRYREFYAAKTDAEE